MTYISKNKKTIMFCLFLCVSYNSYFIFLLPQLKLSYLLYLDFLLLIFSIIFILIDYSTFCKKNKKKLELMKCNTIIYSQFPDMEDFEVAEHDVCILQEQLQKQIELNVDVQDYIAKWCHEVKIPLAAALLMYNKIEDIELRGLMHEQLERMNHQLKYALLGCKVQSTIFDIQIKLVNIDSCVSIAIHNNQFFLIKNHFEMEIDTCGLSVYTDKSWFVYVLDQLISNAVKYSLSSPKLKIWCSKQENKACLYIKDYGEGIQDCDIRRIFEKGFTGSNHHNGRYRSTGMGLYMVKKIIEKLGHNIYVESEPERYTQFTIEMQM